MATRNKRHLIVGANLAGAILNLTIFIQRATEGRSNWHWWMLVHALIAGACLAGAVVWASPENHGR